jgi:hypothetical protein
MHDEPLAKEFLATLETAATCLNEANVHWMVFGGAALALYGLNDSPVRDIDIILSGTAAADLCQHFSWPNHSNEASARFRSDYVLRPEFGPVPVELLGNFRIWDGRAWTAVEPSRGEEVQVGTQVVFLPTRERLAAIFRLCGRQKDLQRAAMIGNT